MQPINGACGVDHVQVGLVSMSTTGKYDGRIGFEGCLSAAHAGEAAGSGGQRRAAAGSGGQGRAGASSGGQGRAANSKAICAVQAAC